MRACLCVCLKIVKSKTTIVVCYFPFFPISLCPLLDETFEWKICMKRSRTNNIFSNICRQCQNIDANRVFALQRVFLSMHGVWHIGACACDLFLILFHVLFVVCVWATLTPNNFNRWTKFSCFFCSNKKKRKKWMKERKKNTSSHILSVR